MSEILKEKFEQLHPEHREVDLEEFFSEEDLLMHRDGGPYCIGAMTSSLDGRAAWRGVADELRTPKDNALFHGLRSLADAIVVGEHAARAERYGPIIKDKQTIERRLRRGQEAQPLAVIVSKKFEVPWDIPLFADKSSRCLIWTTERGQAPPQTRAHVEIMKEEQKEPSSFGPLLDELRDREVSLLLLEGGPSLHASFEREGLVEELFLALEPEMLGQKNISIVEGDFLEPQPFSLRSVLRSGSELFLHYHKEAMPLARKAEKLAAIPA